MATLIAYYSRTGENYWDGQIRTLEKGNTERVAEFIREAVGGELFQIRTTRDYPADYMECIGVAKEELRVGARPAVEHGVDASAYDTIFLGYPNWWGTCPMCVFTFLDGLDLSGKRIVPFCTNEGSGMGSSVRDLRRLYPDATVEEGLSVHGAEAEQSRETVAAWVWREK